MLCVSPIIKFILDNYNNIHLWSVYAINLNKIKIFQNYTKEFNLNSNKLL